MAQRKTTGRKQTQTGKKNQGQAGKNKSLPLGAIFWLFFFIVITGFFLANRATIRKNFDLLTRRLGITGVAETPPGTTGEHENEPPGIERPEQPSAPVTTAAPSSEPAAPPQTPPPLDKPSVEKPVAGKNEAPAKPEPETAPAARTQPAPVKPQQPAQRPAAVRAKPAETRTRRVYFTQIDKDGAILRLPVTRNIAASASPMQDSLNALLAGPSVEEKRRGLISLIPANTRILSSVVRGSTAYISFSEEFQYNTYGVEGYAAQLTQIVWTATEFPTVSDVQILVEGRRVDYLGEGIWIGSPVSRDSL